MLTIDLDSFGSWLAVGDAVSSNVAAAGDGTPQAQVARIGDAWVASAQGRSSEDVLLNGRRLRGSARLSHRDVLEVSGVTVAFHGDGRPGPMAGGAGAVPPTVSTAERRVLEAFARPWVSSAGTTAPAANAEIAEELVLSVHTVKSHMRKLFEKFELGDVPRSRKRTALADAALRAGLLERPIGS